MAVVAAMAKRFLVTTEGKARVRPSLIWLVSLSFAFSATAPMANRSAMGLTERGIYRPLSR
jgi:uncharacterized membrane protein